MKASDQIKRAALMKTMDYLLEDPVRNVSKVMDMLDKVAPADLFPSQRQSIRAAIDSNNSALFCWMFTYMPAGAGGPQDLGEPLRPAPHLPRRHHGQHGADRPREVREAGAHLRGACRLARAQQPSR